MSQVFLLCPPVDCERPNFSLLQSLPLMHFRSKHCVMAGCAAWYYKDAVWKNDSLVAITADSGYPRGTRTRLERLSKNGKRDAQDLLEALKYLKRTNNNQRNPFGCAEPHAVSTLLEMGASINQIFLGITREPRISTHFGDHWKGEDYGAVLKPCENCSLWLTKQDRQGTYMVNLQEIYRYRDKNRSLQEAV